MCRVCALSVNTLVVNRTDHWIKPKLQPDHWIKPKLQPDHWIKPKLQPDHWIKPKLQPHLGSNEYMSKNRSLNQTKTPATSRFKWIYVKEQIIESNQNSSQISVQMNICQETVLFLTIFHTTQTSTSQLEIKKVNWPCYIERYNLKCWIWCWFRNTKYWLCNIILGKTVVLWLDYVWDVFIYFPEISCDYLTALGTSKHSKRVFF